MRIPIALLRKVTPTMKREYVEVYSECSVCGISGDLLIWLSEPTEELWMSVRPCLVEGGKEIKQFLGV